MKSLLMRLLRIYKRWFSPALTPACRYLPTCSEYALEAVERHGCWRGSLLTAGRLLRCQPWGGSGYDPVPASFLFSPYGACENAKMGRASKVQEGTVYQPSTRKPRVPGDPAAA